MNVNTDEVWQESTETSRQTYRFGTQPWWRRGKKCAAKSYCQNLTPIQYLKKLNQLFDSVRKGMTLNKNYVIKQIKDRSVHSLEDCC